MNIKFDVKQRIGFFFTMLFTIFLALFSVFIGVDSWTEYLQFPSSFIYSSGYTFILLFPLMVIPLTLLSIDPILKGIRSPLIKAKKLTKWLVSSFVIAIVIPIFVSIFYINIIENKGYVSCKGVPIGYTPDRGTRYVLDLTLCNK